MEYASEKNGMEVAIVGMAVRFPQSNTLSEYWSNIVQAKECVTFFSEQALLAEGIDQATLITPTMCVPNLTLRACATLTPRFWL